MRNDEKRLRKLRALFDAADNAKQAAELSREIRMLEKRTGATVQPSSADDAQAELESELQFWLSDFVIPRFGKPGVTVDQLWAEWERPMAVLDGKVWMDTWTGEPHVSPAPARPLLNNVNDVVWCTTGPLQVWGLGVHHADLIDGTHAFDGLPAAGGFVPPGSHPDTHRYMTDVLGPAKTG